jgi:hypothetical protein
MSETYELEVTGELPLEFEGECIFSESSHWTNGVERSRYHLIAIYTPDDNSSDRILHIEYKTNWQGEPSHSNLWELQSPEEVIEVLNAYDPLYYLIGFPKSPHFEDKQETLKRQIKSDWLALKTQALQALGLKRSLRQGKAPHPLGPCANAGLSLPQQVREAIARKAAEEGRTPSEVATEILRRSLL